MAAILTAGLGDEYLDATNKKGMADRVTEQG